ncbi:hypothetical protein, partial [Sinorhizobium meliloti]|uniref:hypothetical protein n=1 Tax=Rhizobium meliloti TaxID=382 RepID=UPI001AECCBA9
MAFDFSGNVREAFRSVLRRNEGESAFMEREAGGKPLHNLPHPASGNPILKIDDRPAPVVPYPHLALSASRIGAC